jgi:Flp pilus assembly protein TadG
MRTVAVRRPRDCRGIASVELAIALPVLLLLLTATVEVGRLLSEYDTLTKSVRNAARYLAANALQGTTGVVNITAPVQSATRNLVVTGNVTGTGGALLPGLVSGNVTVTNLGAGYVVVSASYTYQPVLGATLPTFGNGPGIALGFPLNATTVMRAL